LRCTTDAKPRDIDQKPEVAPQDVAAANTETGPRVYFLITPEGQQNDKPAAVTRAVAGDPAAVLDQLFKGVSDEESTRLRTAIPGDTRLVSPPQLRTDGTLIVNVSDAFFKSTGDLQIKAIAQIVFSASELPGVERVKIEVDGQSYPWPRGDGTLADDSVTQYDYPELDPTTQPDYPPLPSPTTSSTVALQRARQLCCYGILCATAAETGGCARNLFTDGAARLGVLTSGGDAQGMNAAVRAVVRAGINRGIEVYAVNEGYKGMVEGGGSIRPMAWNSVAGILQLGGTVIGTARCQEFFERDGRRRAVRNLLEHGIDRLVVIGGDGSLTGASLLCEEWPEHVAQLVADGDVDEATAARHPRVHVVGLVGSIDNDMAGTDMTIGADTALRQITSALDAISSTAASHQRTFVVEVMGRKCGYLALRGAIAGGADWLFIPEDPPEAAGKTRCARHCGPDVSTVGATASCSSPRAPPIAKATASRPTTCAACSRSVSVRTRVSLCSVTCSEVDRPARSTGT
jgi:hypothetical protein